MSAKLNLSRREFPSRIADLGFVMDLPGDWLSHELPPEEPNFADGSKLVPLAVVTAPHAAIILAIAARPAYDDGTLHQWAWYLLNAHGITPRAVGAGEVGPHPAVVGEGSQPSDLGPLTVRFAFLVDGGRLVNLSLTAPEVFDDLSREVWTAAIRSFHLTSPKEVAPPSDEGTVASSPAPAAEAKREEAPASPPSTPAVAAEAEPAPEAEPAAGEPASSPFAAHALAEDLASLDPDQRMNANLRDRGVGLVPRVLAADAEGRRATVGAGAVEALLDVPFGWHVLDDGKRTLVFEPTGRIQISLNLIPAEGRSRDEILDELEAAARSEYPAPEFVRLTQGEISALGVRNIADGQQPLEQYHLLAPHRTDRFVLRARVTATPETSTPACTLAELIVDSARYGAPEEGVETATATGAGDERNSSKPSEESSDEDPADATRPAWWRKAVSLERADRLEEAEKVIREGCPHLGFAYATAELYQRRMLRRKRAGDAAGALEAFRKSEAAIFHYASMATSGGEGAALSAERDEFRAGLVSAFGRDPGSR